jgi:RNA polymerase subunit RPABC4/transcription elongation factor Spt4
MKCAVCGKEFGTGSNCKHCGSDKFTGLGNYSGYNAPVVNDNTQASFESAERQNLNSSPQPDNPGSIICYACGEIIPSDSKFCPYCSRELFVVCPKCGHKYSSQFPACNQCGTNRNKYYEQLRKEKLESEIARVRKKEGDSAAIKIRTREIENSQRTKASTAEGRAELERERRYIDECRKKWRNQ